MGNEYGYGPVEAVTTLRVLNELEELRAGRGISPRRIRSHAHGIMRLPLVRDQLDLQSLAADDLHVAAYSAIGCVIDHATPDFLEQRLIIWTLRYDYSLLSLPSSDAWGRINSGATLSDRHKMSQQILYVGRSTYFSQLAVAYENFADQLVLRMRSPCRDAGEIDYAKRLAGASLRELLILFSAEGRERIKESIAELAMEEGGLSMFGSATASERLGFEINRNLGGEYADFWRSRANRSGSAEARLISPDAMRFMFVDHGNRVDPFMGYAINLARRSKMSTALVASQLAHSFSALAETFRDSRKPVDAPQW